MESTALTNSEYNNGLCSDLYKSKKDDYDFKTEISDTALVRFISDIAVEGTGFELAFTSYYKSSGSRYNALYRPAIFIFHLKFNYS